jgi:putative flippase GtrA
MNVNIEKNNKKMNIFEKLFKWFAEVWESLKIKHPNIAQFIVFFVLSNGVTVLQLVMMPLFRYAFSFTNLVDVNFQIFQLGSTASGAPYYIFDFAAGSIASGGNGGLAFFLAVEITLGIAQIINFFAQRNITFKSDSNPWIAAMWYLIAYIVITFVAAIALGFYQLPIYTLLRDTWALGSTGETIADVIVMIINSAISFWVFFPIFKIIFKKKNLSEVQVK